jgi:hypothetical protein
MQRDFAQAHNDAATAVRMGPQAMTHSRQSAAESLTGLQARTWIGGQALRSGRSPTANHAARSTLAADGTDAPASPASTWASRAAGTSIASWAGT